MTFLPLARSGAVLPYYRTLGDRLSDNSTAVVAMDLGQCPAPPPWSEDCEYLCVGQRSWTRGYKETMIWARRLDLRGHSCGAFEQL